MLEIGSGSGQHAVLFGSAIPGLSWYPTEVAELLPALQHNLQAFPSGSINHPCLLDLNDENWVKGVSQKPGFDAVFTANTLHIVSWTLVQALFQGSGSLLKPGALLIVYGPVKYAGEYTSVSNEDFDLWLQERDRLSGIRNFEQLNQLAEAAGLKIRDDIAMPANNQLLVWQKC